MKTNEETNPHRRSLLAKILIGGAALPVVGAVALSNAQETEENERPDRAKGGKGGKGDRGGKGRARIEDPAQTAQEWIKEFDEDGDGALNAEELTEALKSIAGSGGGGRGMTDDAADDTRGGKGGNGGKGKGSKGGADSEPGSGVVPKRPGS